MYYVIVTSKSLMANDYSNKIVGCYKTMAEAKTAVFNYGAAFLGWDDPTAAPSNLYNAYKDGDFNIEWMYADDNADERLLNEMADYEIWRIAIAEYDLEDKK